MKAKPVPVIREEDSDLITANYYIKIGLTASQMKALTRIGKAHTNSTSPCAAAARALIALGLLNEAETKARLYKLGHYLKAEGFYSLGMYCDTAMSLAPSATARKARAAE